MINSVAKAMKILKIISDGRSASVPLADIAEKSGIPKPTCAHILKTLSDDGYVTRISHRDGYTLGPSLYYLTGNGRYEERLVTLCRPIMRRMEKSTHASVILSVIKSSQKFIIDFVDNEQNIFSDRTSIKTDDIYRTATGRAILAHMNRDEMRAVWEKYGAPPNGHWDEVKSLGDLFLAAEKMKNHRVIHGGLVKKQGAPIAEGIATPLFSHGRCIAAIGLAVWENNIESSAAIAKLERILLRGADEIQRLIDEM